MDRTTSSVLGPRRSVVTGNNMSKIPILIIARHIRPNELYFVRRRIEDADDFFIGKYGAVLYEKNVSYFIGLFDMRDGAGKEMKIFTQISQKKNHIVEGNYISGDDDCGEEI